MLPLADRLHQAAHLTGDFTLRSGKVSHEYLDKYLFEGDPQLLGAVCDELVRLLAPADSRRVGR